MAVKVLLVDDDSDSIVLLSKILSTDGYVIDSASNSEEAKKKIKEGSYDIIMSDLILGDVNGIELLKYARESSHDPCFILITAYGSVETAIEAVRLGAFDYVAKPFDHEHIKAVLKRAIEHIQSRAQVKPEVEEELGFKHMIGRSQAMFEVYKTIARVAATDIPVLIQGESGSGKELVARAIHFYSPRTSGRFIAINCAALPETLLESELFGYVKGAFTGAIQNKKGLFEEASGGTLFLDEIAEMPLALQTKLLRVLEEKEIRPIGGTESIKVDARIVSSTNRNIERLVAEGLFRSDLFYRINVGFIRLPSLRERQDDIELLVKYFLQKLSGKYNRLGLQLSDDALGILKMHGWPGNVRELENTLERAVTMTSRDILKAEDFQLSGKAPEKPAELKTLDEVEEDHILAVLSHTGGNKLQAAKILRIDYKTLLRKLKKYHH